MTVFKGCCPSCTAEAPLIKNDRPTGRRSTAATVIPLRISRLLASLRFIKRSNSKKFSSSTQRLPPRTPVYSYHWISEGLSAKIFPSVSQDQLSDQFR